MKRSVQKKMMSSKTMTYRTPKEFLRVLRAFAGDDGIALDPAGHKKSIVRAKKQFLLSLGEDGLKKSWVTKHNGIVYVNPPYGRQVIHWIRKAIRQYHKSGERLEIIMLVAARPDTIWFQELAMNHASRVCFWRGRLKFLGPTKSGKREPAMFPSAVLYFGRRPKLFTKLFQPKGFVAKHA